jgi:hypothetical protein
MRSKVIVFALVTVLSNTVYGGDIFRCVAANGEVMFTNMACPTNSQVQHVASYEPVADTPARTDDANAAAASAWEAREAAQQAKEAAYQAEAAAYERAQAAQSEQSYDGTEYEPAWFAPFYPQFGSRFHGHHHHPHPHQGNVAQSAAHSLQHTMSAPHAQAIAFTFHR